MTAVDWQGVAVESGTNEGPEAHICSARNQDGLLELNLPYCGRHKDEQRVL